MQPEGRINNQILGVKGLRFLTVQPKIKSPLSISCQISQMLLPNPVLEDAVNPSAARIFASSPSGFRQTVLDCVLASKRIEGEKIFTKRLACFCLHRLVQFCRISQIASNLIINRKSFNEKCIISIKWRRKMLFCYRFIQRNSCELQGPVVRRPISVNPGLNFNLGFYFSLFKSCLRIIFSIYFQSIQSKN